MRRAFLLVLFAAAVGACHRPARVNPPTYVVTAEPLDVRPGGVRLCLAIDPRNPRGIWWWEPGRSGCASRSTGPGVFEGEDASVRSSTGGSIEGRFRLQLISLAPGPSYADIVVTFDGGRLRSAASGSTVATVRRTDLILPELLPFGSR